MPTPWRSLTARGRLFLIVGLAGTAAALWWRQRDLAFLGVLLLVLPLTALLVLGRTRVRLTSRHEVWPVRAPLGAHLRGRLHLEKSGALPMGLLQFEDAVPAQLGRRPRFTAHQLAGSWSRDITYPLLALSRGQHRVGPVLVRAADPFGLAVVTTSLSDTAEVLITPHVHPLPAMTDAGGAGTSGDTSPERVGRVGRDDVMVREYQSGDDVRRVHWRSTARWGQLMVRREEQAWEPSVTVVLDNRAARHGGSGSSSSFEWAVSAAASICDHFAAAGYRVSLIDASGPVVAGGSQDPSTTRETCLVALAAVTASSAARLDAAVTASHSGREGEVIIVVLAGADAGDVAILSRLRRSHSQGFALVLDTSAWGGSTDADHTRQSIGELRDHRWRVAAVGPDLSVPAAWNRLAGSVVA